MLNVDRFKVRNEGSDGMWSLIEFLVQKQGGFADADVEEKTRRTWYLDTPELALRRRGYVLRLRDESRRERSEYKLTLKYRAADRYVSASADVFVSGDAENKYGEKNIGTKFEEDIIPPFISRFSHSILIEMDKEPELNTLVDVKSIFPGLGNLEIPEESPISVVNDFKAHEIKRELGKIEFGEKPRVKPCLSIWYLLGQDNEIPLVAEFSFDYDILENEHEERDRLLEQFPPHVVEASNIFFKTLQKQSGWINLDATTKTAYAYDAL